MKKWLVVVVLSLFLMSGLAWPCRISGDCMEPAIQDGHLYFLNRLSPVLRSYQIGDVIAFWHEEKMWISRIVGLEADTVQLFNGGIVVNGSNLQDHIHRDWAGWDYGIFAIDSPFKISEKSVYVLSDNLSAKHDDSRVFGPILKDSIVGLVW